MPYTISHVAAVLPLKRCWKNGSFRAAAIGSMIPDVGYFLECPHSFNVLTHGWWTSLMVGVPLSLLFLCLFLTLENNLYWMFRLREPQVRYSVSRKSLGNLLLSIGIGIWSHVVWDNFTHQISWGVDHISQLSWEVMGFPIFKWLQYLSSLGGLGLLAFFYSRAEKLSPDLRRAKMWKVIAGVSAVIFVINAILFPPVLKLRPLIGEYVLYGTRALAISLTGLCCFLNWERPKPFPV